jgi:hypothetical protein
MEPRWPVALTVLATLFLLAALPGRLRLFPPWVSYVVAIAVIVPLVAVALSRARALWLRVESAVTLLFCVFCGLGTLASLANLVNAMVHRPGDITGTQLLSSSIAVWLTNVLAFSLLYWQIDRGGPAGRADNASTWPDWTFPATEAPEDVPPDWRPTFVDYLFLGFCTATAFSPTDALPLTSRAKMLMMFESAISLVTVVVVASRAINILGS